MVWNKTPDSVIEDIKYLLHDFELRYVDIAELVGVSSWTVEQVNKSMPPEFKAQRYSGVNKYAKLRSNPMRGKSRMLHHNAIEGYTMSGSYKAIWAPDWWTGPTDGNRVLEHQVVWAQFNEHTEIPSGCVIHHKDHNKLNNDPHNLELMSRKDHARLHAYENFLKSSTTISKESTT